MIFLLTEKYAVNISFLLPLTVSGSVKSDCEKILILTFSITMQILS